MPDWNLPVDRRAAPAPQPNPHRPGNAQAIVLRFAAAVPRHSPKLDNHAKTINAGKSHTENPEHNFITRAQEQQVDADTGYLPPAM